MQLHSKEVLERGQGERNNKNYQTLFSLRCAVELLKHKIIDKLLLWLIIVLLTV